MFFMQRCLLVEFMLTSVVFFNSLTASKVESFKEITNIQRWIESRMLLIWENGQRKRKYGDKKGVKLRDELRAESIFPITDLMLIRYWARATDSQLPLMVMVRSRLAGASRSSQFEIRIIAPLICLRKDFVRFFSRCAVIGQCLSQPGGHEGHKSF